MTTIRLYGLTDGYGSYAQVLRGFLHAFREYGYGPDRLVVVPLEPRMDDEPLGLPEADVGIYLGPPSAASALNQHARHKLRFVMVAPNSDRLPEATMKIVNEHATHVLVPSEWSAGVTMHYSERTVMVAPHGVFPEFRERGVQGLRVVEPLPTLETLHELGEFRVLHLSSSSRDRKGTLQLVKAWASLKKRELLPKRARLVLVLVPETRITVMEWLVDHEYDLLDLNIHPVNRLGARGEGAAPAELAISYRQAHVLCQPSRAESFGMCPIEALSCGVPIIATRATGHGQWFSPGLDGAVPVRVGPYVELDDLPGSRAPKVYSSAIAEALEYAYTDWVKLKAAALASASAFREKWSWEAQLTDFRKFLEEEVASA